MQAAHTSSFRVAALSSSPSSRDASSHGLAAASSSSSSFSSLSLRLGIASSDQNERAADALCASPFPSPSPSHSSSVDDDDFCYCRVEEQRQPALEGEEAWGMGRGTTMMLPLAPLPPSSQWEYKDAEGIAINGDEVGTRVVLHSLGYQPCHPAVQVRQENSTGPNAIPFLSSGPSRPPFSSSLFPYFHSPPLHPSLVAAVSNAREEEERIKNGNSNNTQPSSKEAFTYYSRNVHLSSSSSAPLQHNAACERAAESGPEDHAFNADVAVWPATEEGDAGVATDNSSAADTAGLEPSNFIPLPFNYPQWEKEDKDDGLTNDGGNCSGAAAAQCAGEAEAAAIAAASARLVHVHQHVEEEVLTMRMFLERLGERGVSSLPLQQQQQAQQQQQLVHDARRGSSEGIEEEGEGEREGEEEAAGAEEIGQKNSPPLPSPSTTPASIATDLEILRRGGRSRLALLGKGGGLPPPPPPVVLNVDVAATRQRVETIHKELRLLHQKLIDGGGVGRGDVSSRMGESPLRTTMHHSIGGVGLHSKANDNARSRFARFDEDEGEDDETEKQQGRHAADRGIKGKRRGGGALDDSIRRVLRVLWTLSLSFFSVILIFFYFTFDFATTGEGPEALDWYFKGLGQAEYLVLGTDRFARLYNFRRVSKRLEVLQRDQRRLGYSYPPSQSFLANDWAQYELALERYLAAESVGFHHVPNPLLAMNEHYNAANYYNGRSSASSASGSDQLSRLMRPPSANEVGDPRGRHAVTSMHDEHGFADDEGPDSGGDGEQEAFVLTHSTHVSLHPIQADRDGGGGGGDAWANGVVKGSDGGYPYKAGGSQRRSHHHHRQQQQQQQQQQHVPTTEIRRWPLPLSTNSDDRTAAAKAFADGNVGGATSLHRSSSTSMLRIARDEGPYWRWRLEQQGRHREGFETALAERRGAMGCAMVLTGEGATAATTSNTSSLLASPTDQADLLLPSSACYYTTLTATPPSSASSRRGVGGDASAMEIDASVFTFAPFGSAGDPFSFDNFMSRLSVPATAGKED